MSIINTNLNNDQYLDKEFLELYKKGETGLGRVVRVLKDNLSKKMPEIDEYGFKNNKDRDECKYVLLCKSEHVCKTAMDAEKKYYKTKRGKLKKLTQDLAKKTYRTETSLDRAESLLSEINTDLGANNPDQFREAIRKGGLTKYLEDRKSLKKNLQKQAVYDAEVTMARNFAKEGKKEITYTIQGSKENGIPSGSRAHITPHGDLYTDLDANQSFFFETLDGRVYKLFTQKVLGRGGERIVFLGEEISKNPNSSLESLSNKNVNMKKVAIGISLGESAEMGPETIRATQSAFSICQELQQYPGIVKFKDCFTSTVASFDRDAQPYEQEKYQFTFNHQKAAWTVAELYDEGDFSNFLKMLQRSKVPQSNGKAKGINEEEKQSLKKHFIFSLIDICAGLYEKKVVHRDLKPENLFIKKNEDGLYEAVLNDFSFASFLKDISKQEDDDLDRGTLGWYPPELRGIIEDEDIRDHISTANDIWALGLMCFQIWTGAEFAKEKLGTKSLSELAYQMGIWKINQTDVKTEFKRLGLDRDTDPMVELIYRMLQVDPKKRLNARELQEFAKEQCSSSKPALESSNSENGIIEIE